MEAAALSFDPASHRYALAGVELPSVTQVLDSIFPSAGSEFWTESARRRGSAVHAACQFYLEGDLDEASVDPQIAGYVEALKAFLRESGFTATHSEQRIASSRHRFAGTLDLVGPLDRWNALIDFKTGEPAPQHGLQTGAYQIAFEEMMLGRIDRRFGLYLKESGKYRLIEHKNIADRQIFLAGLGVWQWRAVNA